MRLGILTGLAFEAELLRPLPPDVIVVCAGMGPARAAQGTSRLIDRGATHLLSFGIAAALEERLKAGTVVVSTKLGETPCDPAWVAATAQGLSCLAGAFVDAGGILDSPTAKVALRSQTGAIAADMESCAMARAAGQRPCIAVRAISDEVDQSLPRAAVAGVDEMGRVRIGSVLKELVRGPGQIGDLIRLARSTARARHALARSARLGLPHRFFVDVGDE